MQEANVDIKKEKQEWLRQSPDGFQDGGGTPWAKDVSGWARKKREQVVPVLTACGSTGDNNDMVSKPHQAGTVFL